MAGGSHGLYIVTETPLKSGNHYVTQLHRMSTKKGDEIMQVKAYGEVGTLQ